jgi:flagellar hook-associated protein 3 FlgL
MRITQQMATAATVAGLQSTSSKLDNLQAQLSSGRQITKPSDDPTGTVTALELRTQVAQSNQFQTNANSATSWLSMVDSTMSSVNSQLQKARSLVVQGLSSGTSDANSNAALASEIDGIAKSLLSLSNTSFQGRPIFGGTTSATAAFTQNSGTGVVTYSGNAGVINKDVGPTTTVQVNQTGTDVFGADGANVFDLLSSISSQLRSGTLASSQLTALDSARQTASLQQSVAGSALNRVTVSQSNMTNNVLQYKTQLSTLQDVDIASMAIQVNAADMAYQASLATTAKISQTSLLDFLR